MNEVTIMSYSVEENGSSVVTYDLRNPIVRPSAKGVAIMKTSDRGWYESFTEFGRSRNTNLFKPGLIPGNLSGDVKVRSIVLIFVCEGVRDVAECVEIG
jgi:hypothetical protein